MAEVFQTLTESEPRECELRVMVRIPEKIREVKKGIRHLSNTIIKMSQKEFCISSYRVPRTIEKDGQI